MKKQPRPSEFQQLKNPHFSLLLLINQCVWDLNHWKLTKQIKATININNMIFILNDDLRTDKGFPSENCLIRFVVVRTLTSDDLPSFIFWKSIRLLDSSGSCKIWLFEFDVRKEDWGPESLHIKSNFPTISVVDTPSVLFTSLLEN